MKLKHNFNVLPLIMLAAAIIFTSYLTGCKKDKEKVEPVKTYRLSEISANDEGDITIAKINYTNNKYTGMSTFENGVNVYNSTIIYSGNEAIETSKYLENAVWMDEPGSYKYIFSGKHLAEVQYLEEDNSISFKCTYTWNGDNVTEETLTTMYGDLSFSASIKYVYSGGRLTTANWYAQNSLVSRDEIEYDANGKPITLKSYSSENILIESASFVYTGKNMTKINYHHVVEGVVGDVACTEDRVFDVNNNQTSSSATCSDDPQYVFTLLLKNEEGTGNLNEILLADYTWLSMYLFPDGLPSDLASKKKKKSSTFKRASIFKR